MSKQDLEAYWDKREAFTNNPSIEAAYNPDKMKEFLQYKTQVEEELGAKDQRALRAIRVSGQIARGESSYIVQELYPDARFRPSNAELNITLNSHRKLCMRVYDMLVETALDAAAAVAPL